VFGYYLKIEETKIMESKTTFVKKIMTKKKIVPLYFQNMKYREDKYLEKIFIMF